MSSRGNHRADTPGARGPYPAATDPADPTAPGPAPRASPAPASPGAVPAGPGAAPPAEPGSAAAATERAATARRERDDDRAPTPEELESDVARQREELARTVDELQQRLDVKAQARGTLHRIRDRATTARGRPRPGLVGGGLATVLLAAGLYRRRRRRR